MNSTLLYVYKITVRLLLLGGENLGLKTEDNRGPQIIEAQKIKV